MSSAEVTACKELLISSMNRTPDAINSAITRSRPQSSEALSKLDLQPLRRFPNAVQDTFLQRLERSAAVHVASSSHHDVPGGLDLAESGLAVAAYSSPRRRFILGSCGVAVLPDAEDDLDGDWLPISPDQAIGLYDDPANIRLFKDWEGLRRTARGSRCAAVRSVVPLVDTKIPVPARQRGSSVLEGPDGCCRRNPVSFPTLTVACQRGNPASWNTTTRSRSLAVRCRCSIS